MIAFSTVITLVTALSLSAITTKDPVAGGVQVIFMFKFMLFIVQFAGLTC